MFTAQVADLSDPSFIQDQWDSWEAYIEYAWDFSKNCYSEIWYIDDAIVMGTSTCRGKTTTIGVNGKCTTVPDNTNITQSILAYYAQFNMTEGLIRDPFGNFNWSSNATAYDDNNDDDKDDDGNTPDGPNSNSTYSDEGPADSSDDDDSDDDDDDSSEDAFLYLWKNQAETNWVWANPEDNSVVYT